MRWRPARSPVAGLVTTGMPASSAQAAFSAKPQAGKLKALTCTATPSRGTQDVLAPEARRPAELRRPRRRARTRASPSALPRLGVDGERRRGAVDVELAVGAGVAVVGDASAISSSRCSRERLAQRLEHLAALREGQRAQGGAAASRAQESAPARSAPVDEARASGSSVDGLRRVWKSRPASNHCPQRWPRSVLRRVGHRPPPALT